MHHMREGLTKARNKKKESHADRQGAPGRSFYAKTYKNF